MKSPKETALDQRILELVPAEIATISAQLLHDPEIQALQDYANTVSIRRLGFNDHGPVHMRKVVKNAVKMATLLHDAGVALNTEAEGFGSYADGVFALVMAGLLHDVGMTVTRHDHENYSAMIGLPIITRYCALHAPADIPRQVALRSLIIEGIVGHMATIRIHSLEAGLILIADGCDMEKGRARIPMLLNTEARVGDIHKYSSAAVDRIRIEAGVQKPIAIHIEMSATVGFFQVEEVLFPKLSVSPAKPYLEVSAGIVGEASKRYL